jgi:hypothetical protein
VEGSDDANTSASGSDLVGFDVDDDYAAGEPSLENASTLSMNSIDDVAKEDANIGTRVRLMRSEEDANIGTRARLMRSEARYNAVAADKRGANGAGRDGLEKAAAFQANLGDSMDSDDHELMLCFGSVVVLLCMFSCVTRSASLFRCLVARQQAPVCDQLQPASLEAESKEASPAAVDEAEMTTRLKPLLDTTGSCAEQPHRASTTSIAESSASPDFDEGVGSSPETTEPTLECETLREQVCKLSLKGLGIVLDKLQAAGVHAGGYDCAIARPLSSHQVVRVQAIVQGSSKGTLVTPLTLQPCVLYQATVSRRLHAGVPSVPVAFASMCSCFQVALCDYPEVRVSVEGDDVMLFDMCDGQYSRTGLFAEAPELLQDFVLTHRSAVPGGQWQSSSSLRIEAASLEFQQCGLLTDSKVTLVGELVRDAGGSLAMRPSCLDRKSCTPRVLVSDDPALP